MVGWVFHFCFRLRRSSFHLILSDRVISGIGRKWKRSDSSDSDSVELMTPLTTLFFFYFRSVISALTTPSRTPTSTPSLVKTSLKTWTDRLAIRHKLNLCRDFSALGGQSHSQVSSIPSSCMTQISHFKATFPAFRG